MTKRKDIVSVKHTELLGPLVLDDLHRSGYTRFPVMRGTIDTVTGILDISQLLDVTVTKRSETVEKSMTSEVLHVEADEPLPVALDLLQKSHQHMLIVVDSDGKTAGLVTLSDITGSLLGKNRGGVV
jgi:putative hemolysin